MIVRTYGQRNREEIGRTLAGSAMERGECDKLFRDPFAFSEEDSEQETVVSPDEVYNFTFSSQDSNICTFESNPDPVYSGSGPGLSKKVPSLPSLSPINEAGGTTGLLKIVKNGRRQGKILGPPELQGITTLMETQESGETIEHVDEVNFSLVGLRRGQPVLVRRWSLLSLLTICGASQRRKLLRAHGLAKTIIDAILCLSLDDFPSNLAAAALFYILASGDQDNYLLESNLSIGFLIKLLKPLTLDDVMNKTPRISRKLLLWKGAPMSVGLTKKDGASATAISDKVKEILVNSKDIEVGNEDTDGLTRPELSPKWISLLAIEKACFSTVSLEGGTVRKTGGNFKERLRQLGGLDAVFELALDFRSNLEDWWEHISTSSGKSRVENLQCLLLLLKCLKIMENATVLSKENQNHLLGMRKYLADKKSYLSFTKLIINFINVLSDLSLLRRSSSTASSPEPLSVYNDSGDLSDLPLMVERNVDSGTISSERDSQECSSSGRIFPEMGSKSKRSQGSGLLSSETTSRPIQDDNSAIKMRINSSKASSCSTTSRSSPSQVSTHDGDLKMKPSLGKRRFEDSGFLDVEDSQDPFAFNEEEFIPSKWDALNGRKKLPRKPKGKLARGNLRKGRSNQMTVRQGEFEDPGSFQDSGSFQYSQTSCSSVFNTERNNLLSDCLLAAVKILMNLTNDNELGCHQIAACGGLETLSSLVAAHFPSFGLVPNSTTRGKDRTSLSKKSPFDIERQTDSAPLSDQDLLVAVLGLLVNLVEKDNENRSILSSASVRVPCLNGLREENQKSIIPLLCSIFLANQRAGEADEEGNGEPWNGEVAPVQGEKEAEKMIIGAYAALLLAFLSTESKNTRKAIARYLPARRLSSLVPVLEIFVTFHVALDLISPETHKIVTEVIESCRLP